MTIKLDTSSTGTVVVCDECTWWSAYRALKEEARDVACRHEEDKHPNDRHQRNAREQRRYAAKRAAEKAAAEARVSGTSATVRMV